MLGNTRIKLKPLIDTKTGVFCHFLEIGSAKFVIDCGIGDTFDFSIYNDCRDIIESADCILITSFDIKHIGALGLFPNVPTYCTAPTAVLGKILLEDINHRFKTYKNEDFPFEINPIVIKFSQIITIKDITLSSFNGGNFIGNSVYIIKYGLESLVVGYNINQRRNNYLDGAVIDNIPNDSIFVTNSSYVGVSPYSIKVFDENFMNIIKACTGRIIINVNFIKLLDLLCILNREDLIIISKYGEKFINQIKSMIEWASSRSTEIFFEFKFKFGKISDIKDHRIIIIINDSLENSILGTVLNKFNTPENLLIMIDKKIPDFDKLKIYNYSYTLEEITPERKEEIYDSSNTENLNDTAEPDFHDWTKTSRTIFLNNKNSIILFPEIVRKVYDNDYGYSVNFNFKKKIEVSVKELQNIEKIELEHVKFIKKGIKPLFKTKEIEFYGPTDNLSIRIILETLNIKHIILINDFNENALFLLAILKLKNLQKSIFICDKDIEINLLNTVNRVKLLESVYNLNFIKINDISIAKAIMKKSNNTLEAIDDFNPIVIGTLKIPIIRKVLMEKGFQIKNFKDNIIVNNSLKICFNDKHIHIESNEMELLANVRNIIYEYIRLI